MRSFISRSRYGLLFGLVTLAVVAPFYAHFLAFAPDARDANVEAGFESNPETVPARGNVVLFQNCVAQNIVGQCYSGDGSVRFVRTWNADRLDPAPRKIVFLEDATFALFETTEGTRESASSSDNPPSEARAQTRSDDGEAKPKPLPRLKDRLRAIQLRTDVDDRAKRNEFESVGSLWRHPVLLREYLSAQAARLGSLILPQRIEYGSKASPSGFLTRYKSYLLGRPHDADPTAGGTRSHVVYLIDVWESYRQNFFDRGLVTALRRNAFNAEDFRNALPGSDPRCLLYSIAGPLPSPDAGYDNYPMIQRLRRAQEAGAEVLLVLAPLNPNFVAACKGAFAPYDTATRRVAAYFGWRFVDLRNDPRVAETGGNFRDLVHVWSEVDEPFHTAIARMLGSATGIGAGRCGIGGGD